MHLTRAWCKNITLKNLGLVNYASAMNIMHKLQKDKHDGDTNDYVIACEHHPIYTVGKRKGLDYMDKEMVEKLRKIDAEFCYTDRGGLITFHGPGQQVLYPVINIKNYSLSVRCYVNRLEEVVIQTSKDFGIDAYRTDDVGIWVGNDKIAAIGIHCKRFVTTHGLALNCNTDMAWFQHIVPCGLHGKGVTSLSRQLGRDVESREGLPVLIQNFEKVFGTSIS